ncbi:uncharacterized protein LOC117938235 [Etheostoma cragini]|uniref:uncharacterized protein LOC117938235 n=1 Tax=Etheostoma cragini TaxID=417921 RepID=UPI00155EA250|nr:uncharacterized protein LOC117938235 [Etheostoma cragini]
MWTPGLLFLLLLTSCLRVSSVPPGKSLDEGQPTGLSKFKDVKQRLGSWFRDNYSGLGESLVNTVEQIPGVGTPLGALIKTMLLLLPQDDAIQPEFKALNVKLDNFRAEMKWDAWAAGAYQVPVNHIEKAWQEYTQLGTTHAKQDFFQSYRQHVDSTLVLHRYLTAEPGSVTPNLGDLLADRLGCHEKDIEAQFLYLNEIMCKGNTLIEKYNAFKGINTNARANEIASLSASALFQSHQRCLSDSEAYIERDIFERIDVTKKHQEIAHAVRAFLSETYYRYDWLVVAFTTQNAQIDVPQLRKHHLSGFTEVQKGRVTVAVAKQVTGDHSQTGAVKDQITKCIPRKVESCSDVVKILENCEESVSKTYTAVHAFKFKSHDSTNAVEGPHGDDDDDDDDDEGNSADSTSASLKPFLYNGHCGTRGKYTILIKSDTELRGERDLCPTLDCGPNGKCVFVPNTFIEVCECRYPYFGKRCDRRLGQPPCSSLSCRCHGSVRPPRYVPAADFGRY